MFIPDYAMKIIDRLEENGYEAYLVGGSVRDHFSGRTPGDYDMAVSSTPEETERCFSDHRLIETGIKHGTVTVVSDGHNLELTSFRSDGEYTDNRRPENVFFTRDIHADLARRDFTVNAMAYSPYRGLADDFGGREDLKNGIIRAVGDPAVRFGEDALRIMRALRFASVLGFTVEEKTAEAIHAEKARLDNISAERVFIELKKLLDGPNAAGVLTSFSDVIFRVMPELTALTDERYAGNVRAVPLCGGTPLRFAALLCGTEPETADRILKRLKADNRFRRTVLYLLENRRRVFASRGEVRRFAGETGREKLPALLCFRRALGEPEDAFLTSAAEDGNLSEACLTVGGLAVDGNDLAAVGFRGRDIGNALQFLLEQVTDGKTENKKEPLMKAAEKYFAKGI